MKKEFLVMGALVIIIIVVLSGCQEQKATTAKKNFENITLESNVFELVDASLDFNIDKGVIVKVDVKYLFRNIAGRDVTAFVTVEFYNKNDNLLATGGPKEISLLKGYTETSFLPPNIISYSGEKASEIDHVKIIAEE